VGNGPRRFQDAPLYRRPVEARNKINARNHHSTKPLVIRDEQIDSRRGGSRELDRVGARDRPVLPNMRVPRRRLEIERQDRYTGTAKESSITAGNLFAIAAHWLHEDFTDSQTPPAKRVA
jgi:hypothetical protein